VSAIEKGTRVKVTQVTDGDPESAGYLTALWRVGQEGEVTSVYEDCDYPYTARFEAADRDGDFDLDFRADELEAIA
jgi:hypothetical protein